MKKILLFITAMILIHSQLFSQCPGTLALTIVASNNCGTNACANVTGGTPPYTISWSNGISSQLCVSNLSQGIYSVTVSDAMGCIATANYAVTSSLMVTVNTTPSYCRNGSASATVQGGQAPYSYSWNTIPVQTDSFAVGLVANNQYILTVTDDSGCVATAYAVPASLSSIAVSITSTPDTCSRNIGSAFASVSGEVSPVSFHWSTNDTASSVTGIHGYVSLTVTDDSGCVASANTNVINYSPVNATLSVVQPDCSQNNGSIALNVSGGLPQYSYYWMTSPVQFTSSLNNVGTGLYDVVVTDQNNCSNSLSAILTDNSTFSLQAVSLSDTCDLGVGIITITPSNGVAPYTYNWDNFPFNNSPVLDSLHNGRYTCHVTDNAGCVRKIIAYVNHYSPLNINVITTNASCIFTADGTATALANGGTVPYIYQWSNGNAGASVNNLLPGSYNILVTDSRGCGAIHIFSLSYDSISACAVKISGYAFADTNYDCIHSPSESGIPYVKILCLPSAGYTFTDANGYYEYILPPGNYSTYQVRPAGYSQECPADYYTDTLPVTGTMVTDNFSDTGNVADLYINCNGVTPPVPGFNFYQSVNYGNYGSQHVANTLIKIYHDPKVVFISSFPAASNYNYATHEITYNISSAGNPSSSGIINIKYYLPDSIALGNTLLFTDSVLPVNGDHQQYNNFDNCFEDVVGPFDPNAILVTPQGNGLQGYISTSDSVLKYTVRFQNTGNYNAANVKVEVQLDSDVEPASLEFSGSTFPFTSTLSLSGLLTVNMNNIYLPDSNIDEEHSHGFISFRIKQKNGLINGTEILASAQIYFDFNQPVITNQVLNTISTLTNISETEIIYSVSPNPARVNFKVKYYSSSAEKADLSLYDVEGRKVISLSKYEMAEGMKIFSVDVSSLPKGIYIITISSGDHSTHIKIIVQ